MDPYTIFFLIVLILSIIIHEVSHGYVAEMLGDPTARLQGRLTLNPIPHIDIVGSILVPASLVLFHAPFMFGWAKPVPYNPYNLKNQRWGEALVAGAGPGVNILLAIGFGLFIRFLGTEVPSAFVEFASIIVFVNIMLAVFNLIPIPPLDGSKLLKSVLPWKANMAYQRRESIMAQGGLFMVLIFFWIILSLIGPYLSSALTFLFTVITGVTL